MRIYTNIEMVLDVGEAREVEDIVHQKKFMPRRVILTRWMTEFGVEKMTVKAVSGDLARGALGLSRTWRIVGFNDALEQVPEWVEKLMEQIDDD